MSLNVIKKFLIKVELKVIKNLSLFFNLIFIK